MTQTYDEILTRMKKRFFEESGEDPDRSGEILVRLEAVAAEVFALYTFGDFILQQAFAQTSTGAYLDKAGAAFGLARKTAAHAAGTVTFTAAPDAESSVTIDQGTAVCAAGAPYLQYFTDETVTAAPGGTVQAAVTAAQPGTKFNRPAGFIDTVVTPPGGVVGVTNEAALEGGFDAEDDAHLRARVLDYFREYMNGYNAASIRNACMRMDGVRDCLVRMPDADTLQIAVRLDGETASWEFVLEFLVQFAFAELFDLALTPVVAEAQAYDLQISLGISPYAETPDTQALVQSVNEILLAQSGQSRIGENLPLAKIESALAELDGVAACSVQCAGALAGALPCPSEKYVALNTVEEVSLYAV